MTSSVCADVRYMGRSPVANLGMTHALFEQQVLEEIESSFASLYSV